ncbi:hypothetical protein COO60DRAFT_1709371 [Scenedesmus sp. NREL 46B-D3]|nr:hypothetical protein COO60DRAFT_1709371 [Scenedesmus sp. NREL 46B-D3]
MILSPILKPFATGTIMLVKDCDDCAGASVCGCGERACGHQQGAVGRSSEDGVLAQQQGCRPQAGSSQVQLQNNAEGGGGLGNGGCQCPRTG